MFSTLQIVLNGQGKNFCAGIDIASLEADFVNPSADATCPARAREKLLHKIKSSQDTINAIEECRWPVIAAVHGTHDCLCLNATGHASCCLAFLAVCCRHCVMQTTPTISAASITCGVAVLQHRCMLWSWSRHHYSLRHSLCYSISLFLCQGKLAGWHTICQCCRSLFFIFFTSFCEIYTVLQ